MAMNTTTGMSASGKSLRRVDELEAGRLVDPMGAGHRVVAVEDDPPVARRPGGLDQRLDQP